MLQSALSISEVQRPWPSTRSTGTHPFRGSATPVILTWRASPKVPEEVSSTPRLTRICAVLLDWHLSGLPTAEHVYFMDSVRTSPAGSELPEYGNSTKNQSSPPASVVGSPSVRPK